MKPKPRTPGRGGRGGGDGAGIYFPTLRTMELKITLKMKFALDLQLPARARSAGAWSSPLLPSLFKYFMLCSVRR